MTYSMWYNVLRLLSAGGLECGDTDCVFGVKNVARALQASDRQYEDIIPHAVNRSLALLMMGKELPEIC